MIARIVAQLKDGRNILFREKFDSLAEATTFTGIFGMTEDPEEETRSWVICEEEILD